MKLLKFTRVEKPTFYFMELSFCFSKLQDRIILSESQLSTG